MENISLNYLENIRIFTLYRTHYGQNYIIM